MKLSKGLLILLTTSLVSLSSLAQDSKNDSDVIEGAPPAYIYDRNKDGVYDTYITQNYSVKEGYGERSFFIRSISTKGVMKNPYLTLKSIYRIEEGKPICEYLELHDCGTEEIERWEDLPPLEDYKPDGKIDFEDSTIYDIDEDGKLTLRKSLENKTKNQL